MTKNSPIVDLDKEEAAIEQLIQADIKANKIYSRALAQARAAQSDPLMSTFRALRRSRAGNFTP